MASNAENVLKIGIEATLQNANKLQAEIKKAMENSLVVFSDADMAKLTKRITTVQTLLNNNLFKEARKAAEGLNTYLLGVFNRIHEATGGVSTDVADLLKQLNQAQKELAQLEKRSPDKALRHTEQGYVKRRSALTKEETAQVVAAAGGEGALPKNWTGRGAAAAIRERLNNETLSSEQKTELEAALKTLGYTLVDKHLDLIKDLKETYEAEYNQLHQLATEKVAALQTDYQEALANSETSRITGDGGATFDDRIIPEGTAAAIKQLQQAVEEFNRIREEELNLQRQEEDKLDEVAEEQDKLRESTDKTTRVQQNQNSTVGKAVTMFFGYQMVVRQLRKLWNDAIHTLTELDKQLTDQAVVTNLTRQETWGLVQTYQELGRATGFTTTQIAAVNTEYLRQGNTLKDALILTEAAAKAARVAGIDATSSVQYLTTAIRGFKLEAADALSVSDKFANLAAQAATNYEDLAIALSKVASQAALAGMSMDYTLALLTTGLDVTQEAPESIGTALKTVVSRMREISDYGETLEDSVDINAVEKTLKYVNVALRDERGELRSTEEVLDELGRKWETLSANQQAAVAKALAGTRQQARLVAILNNYQDVIRYQNEASLSVGATNAQMQDYLEGMEAATNKLHVAYEEFITTITDNDAIISIVNFLGSALEKITKLLKNPAGMVAVIATALRFAVQGLLPNLIGRLVGMVQKIMLAGQEQNKVTNAFEEGRKKVLGTAESYDQLLQKMREGKELAELTAKAQGKTAEAVNKADASTQSPQSAKPINIYADDIQNWRNNATKNRSLANLKGQDKDKLLSDAKTMDARAAHFSYIGDPNNRAAAANDQSLNPIAIFQRFLNKHTSLGYKTNRKGEQESDEKYLKRIEKYRQREEKSILRGVKAEEKSLKQQIADSKKLVNSGKLFGKELETEQQKQFLLEGKKSALADKSLDAQTKAAVFNKDAWDQELQNIAEKQAKEANTRYEEAQARQKKKEASDAEVEAAKREKELKDAVVAAGKRELQAKESDRTNIPSTKQEGATSKLGKVMGKAAGVVAIASTAIQWTQEIWDLAAHGMEKKAAKAVEKSQEIQNKIYNNRKLQNNLNALVDSTKELDKLFVKSAEDYEQLASNREQLIEALADGGDTYAYEQMTTQDLIAKAEEKQNKLQEEQNKLLREMGEAIMGAAGNYDWGEGAMNFLGKISAGTMAGSAFGPWGALIGAAAGGTVALVEEIIKGVQANEARGKVNEMINTEEGRAAIKQYMQYSYASNIDTATASGVAAEEAVRSTYAAIIDSFNETQLQEITQKYDYTFNKFTDKLTRTLESVSNALIVASDDEASYADRIAAAERAIAKAREEGDEGVIKFLEQRYATLTDLHRAMGDDGVAMIDALELSLDQVQGLVAGITADIKDINGNVDATELKNRMMQLFNVMKNGGGSIESLQEATEGWSSTAILAASNLITNGQTLLSVATSMTSASSTIKNVRDTQAGWGDMSTLEREQWLTEHSDFFVDANGVWNEKAFQAFMNGADMTSYIEEYVAKEKAEMQKAGVDLVKAAELAIPTMETEIAALEAEIATIDDPIDRAAREKELRELQARLVDLNAQRARGNELQKEALELGKLTLSEVVAKQNEQIEKLKEMYQAEEDVLVDSLNKRKEAYQQYFDGLAKAESLAEYNQNREDLVNALAKVGAGTDANSRRKVADLQRQIRELDKQEAQRQKEEARQAVLENIDTEIANIEEQFEKKLENDQALLDSMDKNTYFQYLAYLAQSGQTKEAQDLAIQQMGDLLKGKWGAEGNQLFSTTAANVAAETTAPTISETHVDTSSNTFTIMNTSGEEQRVQLSEQQMRQLVTQLLDTVNRWTGTSYKAK